MFCCCEDDSKKGKDREKERERERERERKRERKRERDLREEEAKQIVCADSR